MELLGDCIDHMTGFRDGAVDLIVTDPPYGINYRSNRQRVDRKRSVKENQSVVIRQHYFSHIQNDDIRDFDWLVQAYRVLKNGGAMYVFCHWKGWSALERAVLGVGLSIKNMIVLNKSNHGMGDLTGSYAPKYELMLFAAKGRHVMRFPNGRQNDLWNVPVLFSGTKRAHPNEKPLSWIEPAIFNSSDEGQTVLDPFMGSGTTGMVCARTRRNFIGIEKDQTFYLDAVDRIATVITDAASRNILE